MTSRKINGWQFFRFYKSTISSEELRSCFQMMSYISNTGQGSLCPQLRAWPSVNSRIGVMVIKRKLMRCR
ncbi:hypothetical protein Golax_023235 [Gossypium laxum]|uniref:Uncharacterized protein n=1 Tax=Gossypium laxum TaxID=34288 RepID=A0A7J9B194_9ROSI|nr:hypothetical protein [Gossypium laxum]